jgi:hypothetical protein
MTLQMQMVDARQKLTEKQQVLDRVSGELVDLRRENGILRAVLGEPL